MLAPPDEGIMLEGVIFTYTRGKIKCKQNTSSSSPASLFIGPLRTLFSPHELSLALQEGQVLQKTKSSAKAPESHHLVHRQDQDRNCKTLSIYSVESLGTKQKGHQTLCSYT